MRARRALIPAAGRGTRMRPISDLIPKELIPLGSRPALDFVLEEAAAGGIESVGLVVREGKETIERFVDSARRGSPWEALAIRYVVQPKPNGLGDAIVRAEDFLAGEPFALMLPDNIALAPEYRLSDLLDLHEAKQAHVLGVVRLGREFSDLYGNCGRFEGRRDEGAIRIERILDKQPGRLQIGPGETVERTCGRSVCDVDFVPELTELRRTSDGDLDETPAVQNIVRRSGAWGCPLPSPIFDVGNPRGYLAASRWLYDHGTA